MPTGRGFQPAFQNKRKALDLFLPIITQGFNPGRPCASEGFNPGRPCASEGFNPGRPCVSEDFSPGRPCASQKLSPGTCPPLAPAPSPTSKKLLNFSPQSHHLCPEPNSSICSSMPPRRTPQPICKPILTISKTPWKWL